MKCESCELEFETVSALANHVRWRHKRMSSWQMCQHCNVMFEAPNLKQHERRCIRVTSCETCNNLTRNKRFCSRSCAASKNNKDGKIGYTIFRVNNKIVRKRTYRDICLEHWPANCVICHWNISFDIHHIDDNHKNDEIRNLVPLCQNHHTMTRMNKHSDSLRRQLLIIVEAKFGAIVKQEDATFAS